MAYDYVNKRPGKMYAFAYPKAAIVDLSFHVEGGTVDHAATLTYAQAEGLVKAIKAAMRAAKRTGHVEYAQAFEALPVMASESPVLRADAREALKGAA
jgi:predicted alpha/beta hydrolase family esterase